MSDAARVTVAATELADAGRRQRDAGFRWYVMAQAVEFKDSFEVQHLLRNPDSGDELWLCAALDPAAPRAASLATVYAGADWFERETAEMFGIAFIGHPDPRKLLLPQDWQGYPLRKSYAIDTACPPYRPAADRPTDGGGA